MNILITGGAGFVGSALARYFRRDATDNSVVVLDNLRRRGSEWNLDGLRSEGVTFVHGDIRNPADLEALDGTFDVLIEASAEASVHAGIADSPRYVLDTNLLGALNCLEFARKRCGGFVFLSSSRVYSIEPLTQLPLVELSTRFELQDDDCNIPGVSSRRYLGKLSLQYPSVLLWRVETGCRVVMPGICVARRIARCHQPLRRNRWTWPVWKDRSRCVHIVGCASLLWSPVEVHGIRRQGTSGSRSASSGRSLRSCEAAAPILELGLGTHLQCGRGSPRLGFVAGIHIALSGNYWAKGDHC